MYYTLDYKIPAYYTPVVDKLYEMYKQTNQHTKPKNQPLYNAISCFVLNSVRCVAYGVHCIPIVLDKNAYSKPLIYNGNTVKRKVSYKHTKAFVEWLHNQGHAILSKGEVVSWEIDVTGVLSPTLKTSSLITLSEGFLELFDSVVDKKIVPILENVIEVRDRDKNLVTKRLTNDQRKILQTLLTYNTMARNTSISIDGEDLEVQLKKVYNNDSFEEGGRNYCIGSGVSKGLLWKDKRPDIRINGMDTVELDYASLHPRILAELTGVRLQPDFDPYGITLPGYSQSGLRKLCKLSMLIMLNMGYTKINVRSVVKAIRYELYKNNTIHKMIDRKEIPVNIDYQLILDGLLEYNPWIAPYVINPIGLQLQNIDSRMMDIVLDRFNREGEIVIPVHDSIVVRRELEEFGRLVMRDAYKAVLSTDYNCVIK